MVLLSTNYSLYSIPAMIGLAYYPSFAKNFTMTNRGAFDNMYPRKNIPKLEAKPNAKIPHELALKLTRMEAAHYNGMECLPLFGLSVLAANYAGVAAEKLNIAAGLFILCRTLYNYVYINQTKASTSVLRSAVWMLSMTFPAYLCFQAAQLASLK
ncbi:hypothetical protein CPB83DRAFT_894112 [Crepidotus variabilis]|uniref:Uncharacterized protein n=1 Tax=Crepidotus variabilis TaxID=179855 RepID=A0A9P6JQ80_9AGAR|nr:hypothetical protein CPB83DRAFT_894112 [Crepidotus variabilis]